ncbi:patched domain-containing protein 3-like [Diadema setosum]|uniref:patched domain-containing protein 3-like n=1 Tax=Diadema setosum TaxID=31175 RepID=UPI003B3AAADE
MARYDCVDRCISKAFYKLGKVVFRHKLIFLLIPLAMVTFLMTGFTHFIIDDNVEYLFTPENSQSRDDRKVTRELFMTGDEGEEFLPNRELDLFIRRGRLIILPAEGDNIMKKEMFEEIVELDEKIRTITLHDNGTLDNYGTLCMKWLGQCLDNNLMMIYRQNVEMFNYINLSYPFHTAGQYPLFIGPNLGGVELHEGSDVVKSAKNVMLIYTLSTGDKEKDKLAEDWEMVFDKLIEMYSKEMKHIKLARCTSRSLSHEITEASIHVVPRFGGTFCMMILFAVLSCIMRDWVLSKPWLGFLGVLSAVFAVISAVGLLSYCGLKFNEIVSLMPFLVLGVGVDNMFIMIAGWRQLSIYLSVEERMARTFSEAAVSITITNLTDMLAFIIGATTSMPGVRTFCIYAGIAMLFVYFYQLSFFGACMAYIGEREANNMHCYTCKKVLPKDESPNKFYHIFCAGGISKTTRTKVSDLEHLLMKFFGEHFGPLLMKSPVKAIIVLSYLGYLAGAIYGLFHITQGLQLNSLARDNSPAYLYYSYEDEYFKKFGPVVSVILQDDVEYWKLETQERIEDLTQSFEASEYIYGSELTDSWLRMYQRFLKAGMGTSDLDKATFLSVLQNHFLTRSEFKQYSLDIKFKKDENGRATDIEVSRFLITSKDMMNTTREGDMMLAVRDIAENSDFNLTVFNPAFVVYDQYIGVLPNTLQTLGIALGCMFLVALVMIPHPVCALWVTFCVISIDTGVIGYMSLWDVPLDPISMLNIILCIGFSVDFSAHITYAFVIAPKDSPNERAISALRALGMPILQGAASSILAISVLSTAPVYVFRIFFKTLFLVMIFGAYHGLMLLPVILSYMGRCMPHKQEEEKYYEKPPLPCVAKDVQDFKAITGTGEPTKVPIVFDGEQEVLVVDLKISTV